jgi:arylsulfatase A-like enzyme
MRIALLALLFCPLSSFSPLGAAEPTKPNVLLIILEDWGPYLGCYGEKAVRTPNLDQVAQEGRLFTNCFSSAPVCSVGRSTLMVGLSQYTTHTQQHRTAEADKPGLPLGVESLPDIFRKAGYFTALGCGYNRKVDLNFKFDEKTAYQGRDWNERAPGQPFYAHLTLQQTHRKWKGDSQRRIDPATVTLPAWYPDTPMTRQDWALGLESVQTSDRDIGDIVARLKKEGVYDDTILVITADHGVALPRAKQFIYDEGLHIPLIMRFPRRIAAGKVTPELVVNLDVVPTLLDLAGLGRRDYLQGRSLADASQKEPTHIFGGRDKMDDTHDACRTVRSQEFRYILNLMPERAYCQFNRYKETSYPGLALLNVLHLEGKLPPEQDAFMQPKKPAEELFDLRNDPSEVHNLAGDPAFAATLQAMRAQLAAWRAKVGDSDISPEFRQGGWQADYPTRPLAEWKTLLNQWEQHILHDGPAPKIAQPRQYAPETGLSRKTEK